MRAPLSALPYYGGKSPRMGVATWIASLLPHRNCYVEPFAGMLGVLLTRQRSPIEHVNDSDRRIVTWWDAVREKPDELAALLNATPYSRVTYQRCQRIVSGETPADDLQTAWAVAVVLTQSRLPSMWNGGWRLKQSGSFACSHQHTASQISALAERLRHVMLDCRDAIDVVAEYVDNDDAVLYLDPPYAGRGSYAHDVDLTQLADAVRNARCDVAISGFESCGWDAMLGWRRHDKVKHQGINHSERVECLWTNYAPPNLLL